MCFIATCDHTHTHSHSHTHSLTCSGGEYLCWGLCAPYRDCVALRSTSRAHGRPTVERRQLLRRFSSRRRHEACSSDRHVQVPPIEHASSLSLALSSLEQKSKQCLCVVHMATSRRSIFFLHLLTRIAVISLTHDSPRLTTHHSLTTRYTSPPPPPPPRPPPPLLVDSYRSGPEWAERFGRRKVTEQHDHVTLKPDFLIETYIDYQGSKWVGQYDPNSLLYVSKAMVSAPPPPPPVKLIPSSTLLYPSSALS
jgi:hypothetical protein